VRLQLLATNNGQHLCRLWQLAPGTTPARETGSPGAGANAGARPASRPGDAALQVQPRGRAPVGGPAQFDLVREAYTAVIVSGSARSPVSRRACARAAEPSSATARRPLPFRPS
jgi:hypothetical protein